MKDKIYYIHSYWDGPRKGLSSCNNYIYYFCSEFSEEQDDYSEIFQLIKLDADDSKIFFDPSNKILLDKFERADCFGLCEKYDQRLHDKTGHILYMKPKFLIHKFVDGKRKYGPEKKFEVEWAPLEKN